MAENEGSSVPIGCENCPNRAKAVRVSSPSLLFGLVLSVLALSYSYEWKGDGGFYGWYPKSDPPVLVWGIFLPVIGVCLGVQIPSELFDRFLGAR